MDGSRAMQEQLPREARLRSLLLALSGLLLAGCSQLDGNFGFNLERLETYRSGGTLNIVVHQTLGLSQDAREAVNHGVPLSIRTDLALRLSGSRRNIERKHREFEIRYLPLSDRYQLTSIQPFSVHTFPRLRHCLAELAAVRFELQLPHGSAERLDLRVRTSLDRRHMPPPMRLPVWFSREWRLDSGWRTWKSAQFLPPPGSGQSGNTPGA